MRLLRRAAPRAAPWAAPWALTQSNALLRVLRPPRSLLLAQTSGNVRPHGNPPSPRCCERTRGLVPQTTGRYSALKRGEPSAAERRGGGWRGPSGKAARGIPAARRPGKGRAAGRDEEQRPPGAGAGPGWTGGAHGVFGAAGHSV